MALLANNFFCFVVLLPLLVIFANSQIIGRAACLKIYVLLLTIRSLSQRITVYNCTGAMCHCLQRTSPPLLLPPFPQQYIYIYFFTFVLSGYHEFISSAKRSVSDDTFLVEGQPKCLITKQPSVH